MDETDARAKAKRRVRPRVRQRDRVLGMVREHDGALDALEIADRLGVHVSTARFHLDALCDEGALERTRLNRSGAGRPRTGYRAVGERLNYAILAEVLANGLGTTTESRARRAERAGRDWARRLRAGHDAVSEAESALDRDAETALELFDRIGFAPELQPVVENAKERTLLLYACPVRDLARAHTDVVCSVHLGVLRGLVDGERGNHGQESGTVSATMEPFVQPDVCRARLISHG